MLNVAVSMTNFIVVLTVTSAVVVCRFRNGSILNIVYTTYSVFNLHDYSRTFE